MSRWVTVLATKEEIELTTDPQYIGWSAIDRNTYDISGIDGETGFPYTDCPQGSGATEAEAIEDLFDQLEETAYQGEPGLEESNGDCN